MELAKTSFAQKFGISDPLARYARGSPSRRGTMRQQNEQLYSPPRRGGEPAAKREPDRAKHQGKPAGGQFGDFLGKASGVAALLLALVLKAFYGRAGATELLWILAPSAWLARVVGGIDLVYEQGAGFISHTHHLVVGPACAGVNFLIVCFLCLFFSFASLFPNKANWLVYSLLIAFAATVAANGLRI